MKMTTLLNQFADGLKRDASPDQLVHALEEVGAELEDSPELMDFFNRIASCCGVDLTLTCDGLEIEEIELSPVRTEETIELTEPGEYQILHQGRLVWSGELGESELYSQETLLAAADEVPESSMAQKLSEMAVWLSVIPGIQSGILKLELEV